MALMAISCEFIARLRFESEERNRCERMRAPDLRRDVKILISLAYYLGRGGLNFLARMLGRPNPARLTVLYYHGVFPEQRPGFDRQMAALHRGARVIPASFRGKL